MECRIFSYFLQIRKLVGLPTDQFNFSIPGMLLSHTEIGSSVSADDYGQISTVAEATDLTAPLVDGRT